MEVELEFYLHGFGFINASEVAKSYPFCSSMMVV